MSVFLFLIGASVLIPTIAVVTVLALLAIAGFVVLGLLALVGGLVTFLASGAPLRLGRRAILPRVSA